MCLENGIYGAAGPASDGLYVATRPRIQPLEIRRLPELRRFDRGEAHPVRDESLYERL